MSRPRRRLPQSGEFPPVLAEFDPSDWWVRDLEDELEVGYARITWTAARRAYLEGGDWESFTLMPAWMAFRGDTPFAEAVPRPSGEPRRYRGPRDRIESHPIRSH